MGHRIQVKGFVYYKRSISWYKIYKLQIITYKSPQLYEIITLSLND